MCDVCMYCVFVSGACMYVHSVYVCDVCVRVWCGVCVCVCVCVCVYACACVSAPEAIITSGMIWTPYDWLNKAIVVVIINGRGLCIDTRRRH